MVIVVAVFVCNRLLFEIKRKERRDYFRNDYLKSDALKRKRHVVLKRDNWRCVYYGAKATQVHHKKYAKTNIGKEPIEWGSFQYVKNVMKLNIDSFASGTCTPDCRAKLHTCASYGACVLSEVVEKKVIYVVLGNDVDRVVEEAMVDVPIETDDFTVGIMDAKGSPLQWAVVVTTLDKGKGKAWIGKKSRLRRYCKG